MDKWYAIQRDTDDDWGTGSESYEEAVEMLRKQGYGLIAVIEDGPDPICVQEIYYNDLFQA